MESEAYAGKMSSTNILYDFIESAILAISCILLIFTFAVRLVTVDGSSMQNTLNHADRLVCSRLLYTPKTGDIVVVTKPTQRREPIIKRIIATEGQVVNIDFDAGVVYVDGTPIKEDYIAQPTHVKFDMEFPQTVPQGCVFVMGDNRNYSWDSRAQDIGMVDEQYILGKVYFRISPLKDLGSVY